MDEEKIENHEYCGCERFVEKHPFLKFLLCALMIFLGAFLAFYVVTDWYFKNIFSPERHMRRMEKAFAHQEKLMQKDMHRAFANSERFEHNSARVMKLEQTQDGYQILVDLVPLGNNEKNVEITTKGDILTVKAADIRNKGGKTSVVEISQSYMFDKDVDLNKISKERKGDTLVIYIPTDVD